jgi:amino acid transporter
MSKAGSALKRLVLGRPMSSGELEHTLLPKVIALPVFSSDPLSSNAYATQEILLVLGLAGTAALSLVVPISIAVACLLGIVVTSYRQTVRAYPQGGGAYRVSSENLGMYAGLLAASALLLDYVLTVSVSITAGVDAIVSAAPDLNDFRVPLAVAFILFVTLINLRGVKESGSFFAVPTYGFVTIVYVMILTGITKCLGGCPAAESAGTELHGESALTFLLVLKAFAAGTTALTGVEAIADGVQAFRYPQSKNAATTLAVMGGLATSMFLGISWLADNTGVVFEEHGDARTVVAQIGAAVFGEGILFYVLQFMTAGILILAANTAFQDFPRLSSILAQDKFMPRQFMNRGDRLVFSNGIVILATIAALLVWAFDAELNRLIQLYLVGVFISFTLSQSGMVLRWRRLRDVGWKGKALQNGFGAFITGTVFFVIVTTKFKGGAWMIMVAIPVVMYLMYAVHKHYTDVQSQLGLPERRPQDRRPGHQHLVILVDQVNYATARAIGYCYSLQSSELIAVTFNENVREEWQALAPDIPLQVIKQDGSRTKSLRSFVRNKRDSLEADDFLTVVVPELLKQRGLYEIIRRPRLHRTKGALIREPGVQVMDIPIVERDVEGLPEAVHMPARNYAVVLVSGVHNSTLQAIEYAETLQPTDIRAVSFGLDPAESERLGDAWLEAGIPHPLEIEASPFRDIGESVLQYLRQLEPDGVERVVTVVMPEFVVDKRRHHVLHGQTALLVKRRLLFERGVVAVSVPYRLTSDA